MLTVYRRIFAVIGIMAAVDWSFRALTVPHRSILLGLVVIWLVGDVLLVLRRTTRIGSAIMLLTSLAIVYVSHGELFSQHVYLLVTIAALLTFARSSEISLLLKITLTLCYAWSAFNKLNESFLSGDVIYNSAVIKPLWQFLHIPTPSTPVMLVMATVAVLTEAFLSFAFWIPKVRWFGLVVGFGFHMVMLFFVGLTDLVHFNRLLMFAFIMFFLYIPFFLDVIDRHAPRLVNWLAGRQLVPGIVPASIPQQVS